MFRSFIFVLLLFLLSSCSPKYNIGYSINPVSGPAIIYKTPVLVRTLADRRPPSERFEPADANQFRFVSSDITFSQPVVEAVTRALQLELANSGIEVAADENFILGKKPYVRIFGNLIHFYVSRQNIPVGSTKSELASLWQQDRFTVKVSINIEMVDTLKKKRVMERTYTSSDSFKMKTDMINTAQDAKVGSWSLAGNEYCIQLLNDHLARVLLEARKDIVALLSPSKNAPKSKLDNDLLIELD